MGDIAVLIGLMANSIKVIEYLEAKTNRDELEDFILQDQKTNLSARLAEYDAKMKEDTPSETA